MSEEGRISSEAGWGIYARNGANGFRKGVNFQVSSLGGAKAELKIAEVAGIRAVRASGLAFTVPMVSNERDLVFLRVMICL